MVEEHGHRFVDESGPTIPSGIIGDLLVDQAGYQCGPYIDMACLYDPVEGESVSSARQGTNRGCVRFE